MNEIKLEKQTKKVFHFIFKLFFCSVAFFFRLAHPAASFRRLQICSSVLSFFVFDANTKGKIKNKRTQKENWCELLFLQILVDASTVHARPRTSFMLLPYAWSSSSCCFALAAYRTPLIVLRIRLTCSPTSSSALTHLGRSERAFKNEKKARNDFSSKSEVWVLQDWVQGFCEKLLNFAFSLRKLCFREIFFFRDISVRVLIIV